MKHYSSGMYVRLAFAVAAHVDPEILVIDEVLAVGDEAFREQCIRHLSSPQQASRTMLMVSHDAPLLERIATRGIVMNQGRIAFNGPITAALEFHRLGVAKN